MDDGLQGKGKSDRATGCTGLMGVQRRYRLLLTKKYVKGYAVLDVGCGDGAFMSLFPKGCGREVVGIDTDRERVKAAARYGKCCVRSALDTGMFRNKRFDTIVANDVLEHINNSGGLQSQRNIDAFHANVMRLLASGGRLIITVPVRPFTRHPEYIAGVPVFRGLKLVCRKYLPCGMLGFDNEKHMPKVQKKPLLMAAMRMLRPLMLYALLLLGRLKREQVFLVYDSVA